MSELVLSRTYLYIIWIKLLIPETGLFLLCGWRWGRGRVSGWGRGRRWGCVRTRPWGGCPGLLLHPLAVVVSHLLQLISIACLGRSSCCGHHRHSSLLNYQLLLGHVPHGHVGVAVVLTCSGVRHHLWVAVSRSPSSLLAWALAGLALWLTGLCAVLATGSVRHVWAWGWAASPGLGLGEIHAQKAWHPTPHRLWWLMLRLEWGLRFVRGPTVGSGGAAATTHRAGAAAHRASTTHWATATAGVMVTIPTIPVPPATVTAIPVAIAVAVAVPSSHSATSTTMRLPSAPT